MAKSRSHFYVDMPLGSDPPTQRHSMYVSHSVDGSPKQDLSAASSSATLPSAAGSVDRLTGLGRGGEKKSRGFFTLKPKTSFSLRPFFSSASIASLSPSKRRRESSSATPRRDSYVQTDDDARAFSNEVGVQTLNASTVDVPVQTCFREWDEGDIYSYGSGPRRPYSAGAYRPSCYSRPWSGSRESPSFVTPLAASPRLLKYAAPGESSPTPADNAVNTGNVNSGGGAAAALQTVTVPISTAVPVKYFAPKQLTSYSTQSLPAGLSGEVKPELNQPNHSVAIVSCDFQSSKLATPTQDTDSGIPSEAKSEATQSGPSYSVAEVCSDFQNSKLASPIQVAHLEKPSEVKPEPTQPGPTYSVAAVCSDFQSSKLATQKQVSDSVKPLDAPSVASIRKDGIKKSSEALDARNDSPLPPTDRPPSALKVERTDSPKVNKSVHFVLSDSDSCDSVPKKEIEPIRSIIPEKEILPVNPRNLDKDFEALLRDLDILTDDPDEQVYVENSGPFKFPLSPILEGPPKQTLLSANLKSVFDSLSHDVLPAILETADESAEVDSKINELKSGEDETNAECDSKKSELNCNINSRVNELEGSKCSSPTPELNEEERGFTKPNDDSLKFTSAAVFTTTKLDLDTEHGGKPENVYDSGIEESALKTVLLPTLPSFFDTSSQCVQPSEDSVEVKEIGLPIETPITLESDRDKMLSRSSSRSSMRSNSRTDFFDVTKKFDSCENLDQLEEEIIRSLCTPNPENLESDEISCQTGSVPSELLEERSASQIRRAILDRLLSGESVQEIAPVGSCFNNETTLLPESKVNPKIKNKYVATLTKLEHHDNDIPSKSNFLQGQHNDVLPSGPTTYSQFDNTALQYPGRYNNANFSGQSSSILFYPSNNVIETSKNNSVFLFPENNQLSAGVPEHSTVVTPMEFEQGKIISTPSLNEAGDLNNSPLPTPANNTDREVNENDSSGSTACDFTNCLRPSKLHNSPFLEQISATSVVQRTTPEPSFIQPNVPAAKIPSVDPDKNYTQTQKTSGQCDYASCLKPSQVQNSMFTAELSELTANKSSSFSTDLLRTNSPLTARTDSPVWTKSNSLDRIVARADNKEAVGDQSDHEVRHKSEVTITLQTPLIKKFVAAEEDRLSTCNPDNVALKEQNIAEPQAIQVESKNHTEYSPSRELSNLSSEKSVPEVELAVQPPPPPPPPPPSKHPIGNSKNIGTKVKSLESMIKNQYSNLNTPQEPCGTKPSVSKSPIMIELEKRFESPRRNSSDGPYQNKFDRSLERKTDKSSVQGSENTFDKSYVNHSPVSAVPFKCNGSNGYTFDQRERSSSLPNGKHENGIFNNDLPYSSKTILTDAPPPPGAVLLDRKIIVEGDQVHTDKYYAIPLKEVTKETTSTTKFVPAPPKYEGIGPTEDGVPIGLRNSVKKENMHNWYKTMFKSLHKADSANDNQEYVIGYSSEPETTKTEKIMRKKSATLDNRSGHNTSKNINLQGYPPSAKSSIEVYKVRPRLIEDYEPGHSSVTDDEISYGSTRYLPPLNTPKPSYEFKNGYEQENNFIRNLEKPEAFRPEEQKVWYKDIQRGGEIPQFGLGKPAPEKPREPVIGPLPPPPLNYNGPSILQQATRPLTLPANYSNQNDNGLCQQPNGLYEVHMRQAIHTEMQHRISPSSSQLSSPTRSILKSPSRSPDLKIPARALFDFKAESAKEIAFKKGDMVLILRQLDKNWYEGEYKGNIGIFPISYVEIVPPEHVSTPSKSIIEGVGKAMFDFTAQTSVELSLKKGDSVSLLRRVDSNWYEARFNNKKGIVPASYLQVLQQPEERSSFSPKPCLKSPTPSSGSLASPYNANSKPSSPCIVNVTSPSVDNRSKFQTRGKKGSNLIEPVMYKAMYSYNPQNTDELELLEGDIVCVVEMCDDGWYVGTSVRTGVFGIFPGNYVEKV